MLSELRSGNYAAWDDCFAHALPYKIVVQGDTVSFQTTEIVKPSTEKYTYKAALKDDTRKPYTFQNIKKRLFNKETIKRRNNTDTEGFWKINYIYLVKLFFTFGIETPLINTIHVIELGCTAMDIYIINTKVNLNTVPNDEKAMIFILKCCS
ncbi:hypothetical protein CEXT_167591 [Caerostris extrusa]|uniref:Uncharacterized protein n=1 Tax=Caerostris extrusa TaxID=172846 RepID=A0AAV4Y3W2_CAEEX|nr:hypothetical protein CEXT_167591 [Caerostris extrusa]